MDLTLLWQLIQAGVALAIAAPYLFMYMFIPQQHYLVNGTPVTIVHLPW